MLFGCLDIPYFSGWAICRVRQPDTPVAVVAKGNVISPGPFARRLGVCAGCSKKEIKSNWPDVLLLPRQPADETVAWEGVIQQLYEITPRIEPLRQGRAYFRPENGKDLRGLARRLGAQIGVSTHRSNALLTSLQTDPGEICITYEDQLEVFYREYPSCRLTRAGFSDEMTHRLQQFGLSTVADVANLTRRHLTAQFGDEGIRLFDLLHPPEQPPPLSLYEPPETLCRTYDVERPYSPGSELSVAVEHMMERLEGELHDRRCQRVLLRVDASPEHPPAVAFLREPVPFGTALKRRARRLLQEIMEDPPDRIDSITLELGSLSLPDHSQGHLFMQKPSVKRAVAAVDKRFPDMIVRAQFDRYALFEEDVISFVPVRA